MRRAARALALAAVLGSPRGAFAQTSTEQGLWSEINAVTHLSSRYAVGSRIQNRPEETAGKIERYAGAFGDYLGLSRWHLRAEYRYKETVRNHEDAGHENRGILEGTFHSVGGKVTLFGRTGLDARCLA